jgi:hypothetical protein
MAKWASNTMMMRQDGVTALGAVVLSVRRKARELFLK